MHIIYIDDSRDEKLCIFSALALAVDQWHDAFRIVREFRRNLRHSYGISPYKELHAWKFVSGRGRPAHRIITKGQRVSIFLEALTMMTRLPSARLFNVVFPHGRDAEAFEHLLKQIDRAMEAWGSYTILVCDEGKNRLFTRIVRKLYVYHPILRMWEEKEKPWRNVPLRRIVEDPFFKDSTQSHFVQLVDFSAYALLRKEHPLASKNKYGLDKAFGRLAPILVREANTKDPEGIIRPK